MQCFWKLQKKTPPENTPNLFNDQLGTLWSTLNRFRFADSLNWCWLLSYQTKNSHSNIFADVAASSAPIECCSTDLSSKNMFTCMPTFYTFVERSRYFQFRLFEARKVFRSLRLISRTSFCLWVVFCDDDDVARARRILLLSTTKSSVENWFECDFPLFISYASESVWSQKNNELILKTSCSSH